MATWTNVGISLVATAVQGAASNTNISYVGISKGCGTLASALSAGSAYTSLSLDAGLPVALSSGRALTITDGVHSQSVTTNAPAIVGATSLSVTSFVATNSYAAHTSGVAPTPLASDIALYSETVRVAAFPGSAGAAAGESLTSGYFDGSQATGVYLLVGFFAGTNPAPGGGVLLIGDVQFWNHTVNADSNIYQADSTI